ncbi:hypothetical protein [Lacinutrix jangbogonensis]|uniref:hypothetical protein n=1 Tax=Lacinutrix jangbogonensis TaxID=1469557 RepID=UPI00053DB251|nr:hypothetical protein [Lacinutrix jangbogonensis]
MNYGQYVDLENKITELNNSNFIDATNNKVYWDPETMCLVNSSWIEGTVCSGSEEHTYQEWMGGAQCNGRTKPTNGFYHNYNISCMPSSTGGNSTPSNNNPSNGQQSGAGGSTLPQDETVVVSCNSRSSDCLPELCAASEIISTVAANLGLTPELTSCLRDEDNCTAATALVDFVNANPTSTAFAQLAAQAICDGGEVDYPNSIVLDSTFNNNPKAKCVYNKLKNLSDTVFKDIISNHFGSQFTRDIKFEVGNIPAQLGNTDAFTYTNYDVNNLVIASGDIMTIRVSPTFLQNASAIEIALTLIHESIHAELMDRFIQLGLVNNVTTLGAIVFNNGNTNVFTLSDVIFNQLLIIYNAYPPNSNGQWNHDLFNALSYRTKMAQNLVSVHPWLHDSSDDFLTNVNGDNLNLYGDFTINELMDYITWIGLEETEDFANNIESVPLELTKKNFVETAARTYYTKNCN